MTTDDLRADAAVSIHLNHTSDTMLYLLNQALMFKSSLQLMNEDIFKPNHVFFIYLESKTK